MAVLNGTAGDDGLTGTNDADTLNGFAGTDRLYGLGGADVLNGGDGFDHISYFASAAAVSINLATGAASGGDATGDTFTGIEGVEGSAFADAIVGDAGGNFLNGRSGNDNIAGGDGDDTLFGDYTSTAGDDRLSGGAGADSLNGDGGSDWLIGGAGADHLLGGDGNDIATYLDSSAAVSVNLATGLGAGGEAEGDTLDSIERVGGSNYNDTLTGDAAANELRGFYGNDLIEGGAGADTIYGDYFDGTSHSNSGTDTASYSSSSAAVVVDLLAGTGSGGDAAGDILWDVENLTGSSHDDRLIGNGGANVLRGGAGADQLDGGAGIDTASYYTGTVGVTINLATGTGTGGDAQGDTFVGIENVNGSTVADQITGNAEANVLNGWTGQDVLTGAAGADRFVFTAAGDSAVGKADRIADFSHAQGDLIDLSAIDANSGVAGDQAFSFIGSGLYTHQAGELRAANTSPGITTIAGDVNGDGVSDFHIQLTGNLTLVAGDFVL
ncbi:calcium-binding protein [Inquilinus sp. OTU3971]|uniref:calcium-binding protein n=1 Tax=Inquilinus sp. OTU3971 TaxID=3043855 RepID=UPI00313DE782